MRLLLVLVVIAAATLRAEEPKPETPAAADTPKRRLTLLDARKAFKNEFTMQLKSGVAVPEPPADVFSIVKYTSPAGELAAYLSVAPKDGKKHPAIIWLDGGGKDCNSIGKVWDAPTPENAHAGGAFRTAGIVMMYPSLRGGNQNPGVKEGFFGEVNDVVAAAEFLAKQESVDPARIYLGGHDTGGTLALLAAETGTRFRAVFSLGPVASIRYYGSRGDDVVALPFSHDIKKEAVLRSPIYWLDGIESPTYVIEGKEGNSSAMEAMSYTPGNKRAHFIVLEGTHDDIVDPVTKALAQIILKDTDAEWKQEITAETLVKK